MNDPLFQIDSGGARKRKAPAKPAKKPARKEAEENEAIHSDDDLSDAAAKSSGEESEEEDKETAAEKRVRLAREYLDVLKRGEEDEESDRELDHDAIAHRLRQDHLESERKVDRNVAHKYTRVPAESSIRRLRGHQLPVTCLALTADERYLYTASKDCTIIKWDVASGRKLGQIHRGAKGKQNGHTQHILAIAVSTDGKFLATGGKDRTLFVWDANSMKLLQAFKGHRDTISGLAFRKGTHTLYSGSHDRTVKIWSLDEMCYIETLFGHQDSVTAIDSLHRECCVTVGGRDRTARFFKIADESQLVFNGHTGNTECIRMVNEQMFVSCGEDGCVNLWTTFKKKPAHIARHAHGFAKPPESLLAADGATEAEENDENPQADGEKNDDEEEEKDGDAQAEGGEDQGDENAAARTPNWVVSVAALPYTDLIASGSNSGEVKLWRITPSKHLECILDIPVVGFVNALAFAPSGRFLVAGVGQEHRLGRWERIKSARNGIQIIPLVANDEAGSRSVAGKSVAKVQQNGDVESSDAE